MYSKASKKHLLEGLGIGHPRKITNRKTMFHFLYRRHFSITTDCRPGCRSLMEKALEKLLERALEAEGLDLFFGVAFALLGLKALSIFVLVLFFYVFLVFLFFIFLGLS